MAAESSGSSGSSLLSANWIVTAVFSVTAVVAAIFAGWPRPVAVGVAWGMFAAGLVLFFAAYVSAIRMSREFEIGVASLYFVTGDVGPKTVKRHLHGAFAVQCIVAVATAAARPFTTLAFGILAPTFAIGLNGLWAARFGRFGPRVAPPTRQPRSRMPATKPQMGQNDDHG